MKLKKAAMFGLDARIALAIFGALSVISGAALYSAIEQAKTTATLADMQELSKALESMYIDNGGSLIKSSTFYAATYMLFNNNNSEMSVWNGPYIGGNFSMSSANVYLYPGITNGKVIWKNDDLGGTYGYTDTEADCASGDVCSWWIYYDNPEDDNLQVKLDNMVDGGDGAAAGRLRWHERTATTAEVYLNTGLI